MRRAERHARTADRVLAVFDATRWPDVDIAAARLGGDGIVVLNKRDLLDERGAAALPARVGGRTAVTVSCLTGAGIDRLEEALKADLGAAGGGGRRAAVDAREASQCAGGVRRGAGALRGRDRAGTRGGRSARRRPRSRPHHRPRRGRGRSRCDFRGLLHRQVRVFHVKHRSRDRVEGRPTRCGKQPPVSGVSGHDAIISRYRFGTFGRRGRDLRHGPIPSWRGDP